MAWGSEDVENSARALAERLVPRLREVGCEGELGPDVWRRLTILIGLWLRYGRVMNLTAARTAQALEPHIIEALLVVELARRVGVSEGARWLDVGAGAGFPGLVLAAAMAGVDWTFIEPRERRAGFLELGLRAIGVEGRVLRGHIERSWRPLGSGARGEVCPGAFEAVSSRAVFAPALWLEIAPIWLVDGGWAFAHTTATADKTSLSLRENTVRLFFDQWSVFALPKDVLLDRSRNK